MRRVSSPVPMRPVVPVSSSVAWCDPNRNRGAMIRVKTRGASYIVDRDNGRWMRVSESAPRVDDGEWVAGGFTLGDVGDRCFAHFANHPDGALGRETSTVIAVEETEVGRD